MKCCDPQSWRRHAAAKHPPMSATSTHNCWDPTLPEKIRGSVRICAGTFPSAASFFSRALFPLSKGPLPPWSAKLQSPWRRLMGTKAPTAHPRSVAAKASTSFTKGCAGRRGSRPGTSQGRACACVLHGRHHTKPHHLLAQLAIAARPTAGGAWRARARRRIHKHVQRASVCGFHIISRQAQAILLRDSLAIRIVGSRRLHGSATPHLFAQDNKG